MPCVQCPLFLERFVPLCLSFSLVCFWVLSFLLPSMSGRGLLSLVFHGCVGGVLFVSRMLLLFVACPPFFSWVFRSSWGAIHARVTCSIRSSVVNSLTFTRDSIDREHGAAQTGSIFSFFNRT
uniref:Uncharacterized protein n=1 Tax=Ixodes ricinus TaxID=34613 RepID=A0A147BCJ9_IXORI